MSVWCQYRNCRRLLIQTGEHWLNEFLAATEHYSMTLSACSTAVSYDDEGLQLRPAASE
jgi:hypothetical protein